MSFFSGNKSSMEEKKLIKNLLLEKKLSLSYRQYSRKKMVK